MMKFEPWNVRMLCLYILVKYVNNHTFTVSGGYYRRYANSEKGLHHGQR